MVVDVGFLVIVVEVVVAVIQVLVVDKVATLVLVLAESFLGMYASNKTRAISENVSVYESLIPPFFLFLCKALV